jgi:hypothetical protein
VNQSTLEQPRDFNAERLENAMFFAETLGPALTDRSGAALATFVAARLRDRKTASLVELREIVSEFVVRDGSRLTADAAIQYLATKGVITSNDARTYRIAA